MTHCDFPELASLSFPFGGLVPVVGGLLRNLNELSSLMRDGDSPDWKISPAFLPRAFSPSDSGQVQGRALRAQACGGTLSCLVGTPALILC